MLTLKKCAVQTRLPTTGYEDQSLTTMRIVTAQW